ncbi:MAG: hypothetical protein E6J13_16285 [Chloroflexi bacterium]|nr:MAG: hypothetical protein E6J13_16285 [Chloroflexota bacterium]
MPTAPKAPFGSLRDGRGGEAWGEDDRPAPLTAADFELGVLKGGAMLRLGIEAHTTRTRA